jgi:tubulin epsilon
MPREVITIQVGQCGNQIGCRFWDLILREHAHVSKGAPVFDAALSSFFRNVDSRYADPADLPVGNGRSQIRSLKARAILVDMEEGVVNSLLSGPLSDVFDARQRITDVSGSGNNWAHGHHVYGPMYRESIEEKVRKSAEHCDSLQAFFLLHSLGGGTGSGLGTFLLECLEDLYPEVFRFVACVSPSKDDDVVTSPYNTTLATRVLIGSAHCVLPVSNDALVNICNQISSSDANGAAQASLTDLPQDERPRRGCVSAGSRGLGRGGRSGGGQSGGEVAPRATRSAHSAPPAKRSAQAASEREVTSQPDHAPAPRPQQGGALVGLGVEKPFDRMNSLVAHLLNNLTSSMRFEGSLNLDLNEITMNLVPFPRMHFLLSSMSPLYFGKDPRLISRGFQQTFMDSLSPSHQLMNVDPRGSTYMAMAFLVRGSASISDINQNITKVRKHLKMLPCNEDAFKIGLCSVPPKGLPYSVLSLANSCAAHHMFGQNLRVFNRLYSKRAHLHHYTQYVDRDVFDEAFETVNTLMKDYIHLDMLHETPASCISPPDPSCDGIASLLFAPSAWSSQRALRSTGGLASLQNFMPRPVL